ncbi:MAG: hypothetical protein QM764_02315 [Chitinophagaceae bacterium]
MRFTNITGVLASLMVLSSITFHVNAQEERLLSKSDLSYLEKMTREVLDSSRVYPGKKISADFGPNNTDGILIRPGGRDCYPSFWIRDYAMSLETGMISIAEQKHMLLLTASTQCDQTWQTKNGSTVPVGAIADHIRIDDQKPIYFPGTYDYYEQGNKEYGITPPYDDQFFFIHMAFFYIKAKGENSILLQQINGIKLIDRLEIAFNVPPSHESNQIVYTTDEIRGVDFGFRDAITITGDLCFTSILKYKAAVELSILFSKINQKNKAILYKNIADKIKNAIPALFSDSRGMLLASTGKSRQPDVWATALAVYYNILSGDAQTTASGFLAESYSKGLLSYNGNIRHVLTIDDYDSTTAWEKTSVAKNSYQNGAYWGTATGWVCFAIAKTNLTLARQLAKEYISDLKKNDFRNGAGSGAPFECFHAPGYEQNPLYLATVSCPYSVFKL